MKTWHKDMKKSVWHLFAYAALIVVTAIAQAASGEIKFPIKLAVFEFELDDFSAGGPIAGESPEETARLHKMTLLARSLLAESGLFDIVDIDKVDDQMVKSHWLRKCNGCEAKIARGVGAQMALVGVFRKINVMEQNLDIRIRDASNGELMKVAQTDYRGETDESWTRALKWLIKHRIVEPELARRKPENPQ